MGKTLKLLTNMILDISDIGNKINKMIDYLVSLKIFAIQGAN